MKLLIEGAKLSHIDRNYEGEIPCELGLILKETVQDNYWKDLGETVVRQERYLFEILSEIAGRYKSWLKNNNKEDYHVFFGYHITEEPLSWEEAEERYTAITLGAPDYASVYHTRSDLTGYLWTNVSIKQGGPRGHNVYNEILTQIGVKYYTKYDKYLTMLFEIKPKKG